MKPDEIEDLFRELRAKVEAGTMSEDEFEAQLREFLYQDESGNYWTIGAQTQNWYRHEHGDWVRASPPPSLHREAGKGGAPVPETAAVPPGRRGGLNRRVVLGVLGLVIGAFLVLAGVLYYQLGRAPSTGVPVASTPAATSSVTSTPIPEQSAPTSSPSAAPPATKQASATPQVTVTREAPTSTPLPPTPTPEAAPSATLVAPPAITHNAPVLVLPEDGAERGPRYQAVLTWEPVDNLRDNEYYHVEVWWSGCAPCEAGYVRDTTWQFPPFHRGQSIDDKYYWHVTVRRQMGEAPDGPNDPATSPPSETWMFMFPE